MTPKEKAEELVMLTPTQEAMQWVWQQRKSTNSKDAISALDAVYQHLHKVTLEKERKVIEDAFENGQERGLHNGGGLLGEFYYDEAFTEEGKSYGLLLNE